MTYNPERENDVAAWADRAYVAAILTTDDLGTLDARDALQGTVEMLTGLVAALTVEAAG